MEIATKKDAMEELCHKKFTLNICVTVDKRVLDLLE